MLDHVGINTRQLAKMRAFYLSALAPLGYSLIHEFSYDVGYLGFGETRATSPKADFWVCEERPDHPQSTATHFCFHAKSRQQVKEFYQAALAAGGRDNGAPGLRLVYHPNYYGAFVLDPDGHNVEAVCHLAEDVG